MKKLSEDHYIIMDDSEIKEGDWVYQQNFEKTNNQIISIKTEFQSNVANDKNGSYTKRKITHSTQPLELICCTPVSQIKRYIDCKGCDRVTLGYNEVKPLSLSEVKEVLGVVDVEKKALEISPVELDEDEFDVNETHRVTWIDGYTQALEDNKEKKYTEDDLKKAICIAKDSMGVDNDGETCYSHLSTEQIIQSLQPKTEWEVEFVDGKLQLVKE